MRRAILITLLCLTAILSACAKHATSETPMTASGQTNLIDLKGAKLIDEKTIDQIPQIAGSETTLQAYVRGNEQIILFTLQNGRAYAFAIRERGKQERIFADRNGDGKFEESGPEFFIDVHAYGY